ncbi:hypothetical protein GCM10007913_11520 [Devosia yakushimensis]|uniref:Uncharacterized protein n=1 Tax=Devosia yakushimensis TaxID=470028 RepID=A0ABQ5UDE2_9HYPH|nr:hypothetical protein [Devosia yakushimensis]GLQ09220.1 hypothetical protein GCM10007913_11520 [Devosia yakushimensis]
MTLRFLNPDGTANADAEAALLKGLTSGNELERCFTRAIAANVMGPLELWMQAEIDRGTDNATLITVIMRLKLQEVASITGSAFTDDGATLVRDMWIKMISRDFTEHAGKVREMLAARRAAG